MITSFKFRNSSPDRVGLCFRWAVLQGGHNIELLSELVEVYSFWAVCVTVESLGVVDAHPCYGVPRRV